MQIRRGPSLGATIIGCGMEVLNTRGHGLLVCETVVVDAKVIERIGNHEVGQMINYLKITGLRVGLWLKGA